MPLDMKAKIFSREEVNAFVNGFKLIGCTPPETPREWNIHVGPGTVARLTFSGPVGADEWDSLLAHIAFYKQWYKETKTTPLLNLSDAVDEIYKRLTVAPDAAVSE